MPVLRGGRPLKRWTWVGAFGPDVMLCAAAGARSGRSRRRGGRCGIARPASLRERTRAAGRGGIGRDAVARCDVPGVMALAVGDGGGRSRSSRRTAREYAWTRKRGGVRGARDDGAGGSARSTRVGLVDESAGYHARHTAWRWSAGVGVAASGEPVAWNLVDGLHDGPRRPSARCGSTATPHEVGAGSRSTGCAGVGGLRFTAEATRARRENAAA